VVGVQVMNKREVIEQFGKMRKLYAFDDSEVFYKQVVEAMEDWIDTQPDEVPAQEWHPIGTAPMNGETIIVADITTDGQVLEHYAAIYHPDYAGDEYCWKSLDYTLDPPIQGWLKVCPTHWRALLCASGDKP